MTLSGGVLFLCRWRGLIEWVNLEMLLTARHVVLE